MFYKNNLQKNTIFYSSKFNSLTANKSSCFVVGGGQQKP